MCKSHPAYYTILPACASGMGTRLVSCFPRWMLWVEMTLATDLKNVGEGTT